MKLLQTFADAGCASLSTFFVGLIALRVLSVGQLAFYAILFSAALVVMLVPQQTAFVPRRLKLNAESPGRRTGLRQDLRRAWPATVFAAAVLPLLTVPGLHLVSVRDFAVMTLTAMSWVMVSPVQDHLRSCMHIAGRHWMAGLMSAAMALVVAVTYILVTILPGSSLFTLIPFGALAVSNLLTTILGSWLWRHLPAASWDAPRKFLRSFKYLTSDVLMQLYNYSANSVVSLALGATALALLETARIAAQPVLVLALALTTYYMPQAIRAFSRGDTRTLSTRLLRLTLVASGVGVIYSAALLALGPLFAFVAGRPVDSMLAATRAFGNSLQTTSSAFNQLYFASGAVKGLVRNTLTSTAIGFAVLVVSIHWIGVFALPICLILVSLIKAAFIARDLVRGRFLPDSQSL